MRVPKLVEERTLTLPHQSHTSS